MSDNVSDAVKKDEKAKKEVTTTKTNIKKTKVVELTSIYVGPSIKGLVNQYSVFKNGIPKRLKEYTEHNRDVKRLIVPVSKLVDTKKSIGVKGTVENISYNNILIRRENNHGNL